MVSQKSKVPIKCKIKKIGSAELGSRNGTVVRAVASHQLGPGSNPRIDAIHVCGLSLLLILVPAPRVFLRIIQFFSLHKNQHFQLPRLMVKSQWQTEPVYT